MARGVKITDADKGYRELVKRVYGVGQPVISVGILAKDGAQPKEGDDDLTLLQVAIWNEFGTDNIPARSFIRSWFDENRDRVREMLRRTMELVVAGRLTKEQALERVAQKCVGEIQARISAGIAPPNAESTIAKKGSSTPLIDTGQLRSSVSYEITEEGKGGK